MDFTQEGNLQLIKAQANRDPAWSDSRFQGYIATSARGAIFTYLAKTRHIYISPAVRWEKKQKCDDSEMAHLDILEHHLSWERLSNDELTIIPDQTNMQQAFIVAKRKQVEQLLSHLPSREQTALKLYYGIDEHPHRRAEIGAMLQVTKYQANRLVRQAIKRIRNEQEQPSRELQIKDRNERMQDVYQLWQKQGKRFRVKEFAREVKCDDHIAHQFLKDRGVLSKSVVEVLKP